MQKIIKLYDMLSSVSLAPGQIVRVDPAARLLTNTEDLHMVKSVRYNNDGLEMVELEPYTSNRTIYLPASLAYGVER